MKIYIVRDDNYQESESIVTGARSLECARERLIEGGYGVGRFYFMNELNERVFFPADQYHLIDKSFGTTVYYQVLSDRPPVHEDVYDAIIRGNVSKLRELIPAYFGVNDAIDNWETPLQYAFRQEAKMEVIRYLIEQGGKGINEYVFDLVDEFLPISRAIEADNLEMVRTFVEHGADLSICDSGGTSLSRARSLEMMDYLLRNGAPINQDVGDGRTVLHLYAYSGHIDLVEYLLKNGADPNKRDDGGNTPLIHAAESGYGDIAMLLLEYGADKEIANNDSRTPEKVAIYYNHEEVANMIRDYTDLIKEPEM